jgi:pimeloyl-ACP methyl ester carboxylesterase
MANPTIVLVHGAFADASGFRGLYDELLGEDVTVVAPPNPLRGLSGGDGEYIKAVIDEIDGRSCWSVIPTAVRSSRRPARPTTSSASSTSPVSLRTRART